MDPNSLSRHLTHSSPAIIFRSDRNIYQKLWDPDTKSSLREGSASPPPPADFEELRNFLCGHTELAVLKHVLALEEIPDAPPLLAKAIINTVDCDAWERWERDQSKLTEIGLALVTSQDLRSVRNIRDNHGENLLKQVYFYHFRLAPNAHLTNVRVYNGRPTAPPHPTPSLLVARWRYINPPSPPFFLLFFTLLRNHSSKIQHLHADGVWIPTSTKKSYNKSSWRSRSTPIQILRNTLHVSGGRQRLKLSPELRNGGFLKSFTVTAHGSGNRFEKRNQLEACARSRGLLLKYPTEMFDHDSAWEWRTHD